MTHWRVSCMCNRIFHGSGQRACKNRFAALRGGGNWHLRVLGQHGLWAMIAWRMVETRKKDMALFLLLCLNTCCRHNDMLSPSWRFAAAGSQSLQIGECPAFSHWRSPTDRRQTSRMCRRLPIQHVFPSRVSRTTVEWVRPQVPHNDAECSKGVRFLKKTSVSQNGYGHDA